MVELPVVVLAAGGVALAVALAPLLIELAALVKGWSQLPHPSTRKSSRFRRIGGGPSGKAGVSLPVKPVQRMVFVAQMDDADPLFFTYTMMGRLDESLAVLKQGHCLFSELPLVLSSSLAAWEEWIAHPDSVAGVTSV